MRVAIFITLIFLGTGSCNKKQTTYTFETAVTQSGTVKNTITATGTVQADTTVSVGTQVSGVIRKVYVDFNSEVKKGQLLAELDRTPLEIQVKQAEATLNDAKSEVEFQGATYDRNKSLFDNKLLAKADFDQAKYNNDKAVANLQSAKAGYDRAVVNLNYALIRSPISGVVLNRAVDQGQTVAASFNTPTLFTIGNDLSHVQVQANVDEADIGLVKTRQPVDFTVDAFPSDTFPGEVKQVRLQPVVTNNVVTYTVIINALNPEKKLKPGMTANITIMVQQADSVLIIPSLALRFTPDASYLADRARNNKDSLNKRSDSRRMNKNAPGGRSTGNRKGDAVWVKSGPGDSLRRVMVTTGISDGMNTEIRSGLSQGAEVVLSMTGNNKKQKQEGSESPRSPFMPQRRSQGRPPR